MSIELRAVRLERCLITGCFEDAAILTHSIQLKASCGIL